MLLYAPKLVSSDNIYNYVKYAVVAVGLQSTLFCMVKRAQVNNKGKVKNIMSAVPRCHQATDSQHACLRH